MRQWLISKLTKNAATAPESEKPDEDKIFATLMARHTHIAETVANWNAPKVANAGGQTNPPLQDLELAALQARLALADEPTSYSAVFSSIRPEHLAAAVRYRLVIADVFVEKAYEPLSKRADYYKKRGVLLYIFALATLLLGAAVAFCKLVWRESPPTLNGTVEQAAAQLSFAWLDLVSRFVLAFTFFGFIVIIAVALQRAAKACLDQQEQLLAKRHSLRQGRLYLHLTGGHVNIEEMERAFNWNHSQENAFSQMPTDAKAPWGRVLEELAKGIPEIVKTAITAAQETYKAQPTCGSAVPQMTAPTSPPKPASPKNSGPRSTTAP